MRPTRSFSSWLAVSLVVLFAGPAFGQPYMSTRLTRVFPPGAKAGTTLEVTLDGADLDDVTAMLFSHPSFKAERIPDPKPQIDPKTKKPKKLPPQPVKFKVTVPADAPIGIHDVRVVGKWGVSNPRAFTVGTLPEIIEKENNNDVPEAQKIDLNATVNGNISGKTDVDYYTFTGKKGERVVVRCACWSIDSKLGPMIQIYDDEDRLIATQYRAMHDLVVDAILPDDGVYYIRVCQFAYQYGGNDSFYRMTVSQAPWIDAVFPPVVEAGKATEVTLFGRNLPNGKAGPITLAGRPLETAVVQVSAPAQATDVWPYRGMLLPNSLGLDAFEYRLKNAQFASNPVMLTFSDYPITRENPANDTAETAQVLQLPCEICGRIEKRGDRDWFAFEAKKGQVIVAECFADRFDSPMDVYFQVWRDEPRQMLKEYDDHSDLPNSVGQFYTRTEDPKARWVAPADGKFYLMLSSRTADMRGGPRFVYRLSVHPEQPDFHVVLIDNRDGTSGGFTLQRGAHQDLGVLCLRDDGFNGDVQIEVEGLPPGVTCEPQSVGPEARETALVMRCAPNAPIGQSIIKVKASADVGGKRVVRQVRAGTVIWPNPQKNQPAHSRLARSLCVAVREPGPFTLDAPVREFSVPVGGRLDVKVRAQRTGGFKAVVNLTRLAGPVQPGGKYINVPNVNLNGNQSETAVKFTIPSNTVAGTYSLVFQGKGKYTYTNPKDKKKRNTDFYTVTPPIKVTVFDKVAELALAKPGIGLKPGTKAALAVNVKRLHKYNGPIKIELVPQGGSQGVDAKDIVIAAGQNSGQLLIEAPKNAKAANYPNFIVRATAKIDNVTLKDETKVQVTISDKVAADGSVQEIKTMPILAKNTPGWKMMPASSIKGNDWLGADFDDKAWKAAITPLGYGEPDVEKSKGTTVSATGQPILARRAFDVPADLLSKKGVTFRLAVASDNCATVYVNGQMVDKDEADHEFSYWNRDIVLPAKTFRPGRNVVAVRVDNSQGSSDLFLDLAIQAQVPIPKGKK